MFKNFNAIVVDDSDQIIQIVSRMLKDKLSFAHVYHANTVKDALMIMRDHRIDWIFSDWEMPDISGLEFLKKVRSDAQMTDVPFIMMTSRSDRESLIEAIKNGVSDYITKPFTLAALNEKLVKQMKMREKRIAPRVSLNGGYNCELVFAEGKKQKGELINLSSSGCLFRTVVYRGGGYVYDDIGLMLFLDEGRLPVKAEVVRIQAENNSNFDARTYVLVGVQFKDVSDDNKVVLQNFINRHRVPEN